MEKYIKDNKFLENVINYLFEFSELKTELLNMELTEVNLKKLQKHSLDTFGGVAFFTSLKKAIDYKYYSQDFTMDTRLDLYYEVISTIARNYKEKRDFSKELTDFIMYDIEEINTTDGKTFYATAIY